MKREFVDWRREKDPNIQRLKCRQCGAARIGGFDIWVLGCALPALIGFGWTVRSRLPRIRLRS